ncbi:hypothetical protein BC831DRAFT_441188 [Entophlyctis helioformis]|nr:hypothetical protein BC831DRAFT_441188 [Entophlyctis helioformis]
MSANPGSSARSVNSPRLAASCRQTDGQTGTQQMPCWHSAGIQLASCWHPAGILLTWRALDRQRLHRGPQEERHDLGRVSRAQGEEAAGHGLHRGQHARGASSCAPTRRTRAARLLMPSHLHSGAAV